MSKVKYIIARNFNWVFITALVFSWCYIMLPLILKKPSRAFSSVIFALPLVATLTPWGKLFKWVGKHKTPLQKSR